MKPTLKDIADTTGLSVSTVSRVLRGKAKRNSQNVEMIIEAAQSLNYPIYSSSVFDAARKRNSSLFVALIASTHIGEFYSSFFDGFSRAARQNNTQLTLIDAAPDVEMLIDLLHELAGKSYDAAILFLPMLNEADYRAILAKLPRHFIVISAATIFHPVMDTVSFDSYRGGNLVAKHFHARGYKDLGVVIGDTRRNESLLRKSGYTDYIQHHSDMNLIWQFEGNYTFESGQEAYKQYSQLEQKPRAIFLINDIMCLGFMEAARRAGVKIPETVALVGYDDLPICDYHFPSISSVTTNYTQLGQNALNMIGEKIRSTGTDHQGLVSVVPVSLSIRESS
ncbi:MAG: LacI family DNA-binding transcriptional regulator [Bacteroidota bacterium]